MCKYNTTIADPQGHRAYLISNLIFSGDQKSFKVSDVIRWLAAYDVNMKPDEVRRELAVYVLQGDLNAYIDRYTVARVPRVQRADVSA